LDNDAMLSRHTNTLFEIDAQVDDGSMEEVSLQNIPGTGVAVVRNFAIFKSAADSTLVPAVLAVSLEPDTQYEFRIRWTSYGGSWDGELGSGFAAIRTLDTWSGFTTIRTVPAAPSPPVLSNCTATSMLVTAPVNAQLLQF
jgi:hypothetical protein